MQPFLVRCHCHPPIAKGEGMFKYTPAKYEASKLYFGKEFPFNQMEVNMGYI